MSHNKNTPGGRVRVPRCKKHRVHMTLTYYPLPCPICTRENNLGIRQSEEQPKALNESESQTEGQQPMRPLTEEQVVSPQPLTANEYLKSMAASGFVPLQETVEMLLSNKKEDEKLDTSE